MRRRGLLLAAFVLAAACGGPPIPEEDLFINVAAGTGAVETGRGFPLTVVRVWKKDLDPSPWDDAALAPLVVRLQGTTRRENTARIEETRRYRAYAFTRDDVTIPPVAFAVRATETAPIRVTTSDEVRIRVRPTLDPAAPGPPELPGPPPSGRRPWWPWLLGTALAVVFLAVLVRRVGPGAHPPAAPAGPSPAAVALAGLERLLTGAAAKGGAAGAQVAEAADIVRDFTGAAFTVPARRQSSEELLGALERGGRLGAVGRAALADLLRPCDRVKFARQVPSPAQYDRLLESAMSFVREQGGAAS